MTEKISAGTIARTAALVIALLNTILTAAGKNPLPYSQTEVYNAVSDTALVITTLAAWWKNNSFTKNAIKADRYLNGLKEDTGESDFE